MSIDRVIVPPFPGLFTSLGLLYTDTTREFVETIMETLVPERLHLIAGALTRLSDRAETWLEQIESPLDARSYRASADLRYLGQNYELNVPLPGTALSPDKLQRVQDDFHETHRLEYGHSTPGEMIQVVNLRVLAVRNLAKPELNPVPAASDPAETALHAMQTVWFSAEPELVPVYERSVLRAGHAIDGPAVIREKESTTLVKPGWHTSVDELGNLVMTRQ
jgi:N-methylhydantoinase A